MSNFVRSLVVSLALIHSSLPLLLNAQATTGAISGTVQDTGGSALIGARVVVQPTGREAATNNEGEFRITNLPAGQYTLTASYVGFTAYSGTATVTSGQMTTVTATLQVGSGQIR